MIHGNDNSMVCVYIAGYYPYGDTVIESENENESEDGNKDKRGTHEHYYSKCPPYGSVSVVFR